MNSLIIQCRLNPAFFLLSMNVLRPNSFPSGKSFFPDAGTIGFLSGNENFFLLARESINYEEAYLNTLTNNCAD